ncbi:tRNA uridine-5-carboxymethylaminomethyl(34) synthesis GTPase MnmE [Helicobacter sp. 23-1046]
MQDTIVGISTPVGIGAICIVRLSGKDALDITLKIARRDSLTPRYATLSMVYDGEGRVIDEAILLYFKAPHSFNGEDICEIHCHGGVVCARMVVSSALSFGAQIARNGEFSKRAFLNGKLDLSQVQAIASLIHSKSAVANESLIHQMRGSLSTFIESVRENLIEILAYSEVHIDYSDDVGEDYITISEKVDSIIATLQRIYTQSKQREGLFTGFRLCIVGKPNVGKSSLLNALLGFDRAIVSPIAGTTRDSVQESLTIAGNVITLIDTAGIRQSPETIEQIGIQKSLQAIEQSNLILVLFDSSKPLDSEDYALLEVLRQREQDMLFVRNKSDLPCGFSQKDNEFLEECFMRISNKIAPHILSISTKHDNLQEQKLQAQKVVDCLARFLETKHSIDFPLLSATYQVDKVHNALDELQSAKATLQDGALELFSFHINGAMSALSDITRPFEYGELLDSLFSNFCLGK